MQASETKLQDLIQDVKQFVIPLFQRAYTWGDRREWHTLWDDIIELYEQENPRTHFIGSIVNMPTNSVPEGVSKFLVIDGQQRLTTLYIILALIRDKFDNKNEAENSAEIHETFLVNKFKKNFDLYKLVPTHKQNDREIFISIIEKKINQSENRINKAYNFFERKIRQYANIDLIKLTRIITNYLSIVSITLDPNDNPYLVFESLNAKGTPLNHADLIRNYFFMRIHIDEQEKIFSELWDPMERKLGDNLTEFIRHYLMSDGSIVKKSDVYFVLKNKVDVKNAVDYLTKMSNFSIYYQKLISPENELNEDVSFQLKRLNKIEVTTAYPLLLNIYNYYHNNSDKIVEFTGILKLLENYLIRRFVAGKPSRELNKIFPSIIKSLDFNSENLVDEVKKELSLKGYPKDYEFKQRFINMKFYGGADLLTKTKLILSSIEKSFEHKESPDLDSFTIEHIMPQSLTNDWKRDLGNDWQQDHEIYLHTIGNLTITAYNSELSNKNFKTKKQYYEDSHYEINKYFKDINTWDKEQIEIRANALFDICNKIWYYFGDDNIVSPPSDVTGMKPHKLTIFNQTIEVNSWQDVLFQTLYIINDLEPDLMKTIIDNFPKSVNYDKSVFRNYKKLSENIYYETNLSAASIFRFCNLMIDTIGLSSDDWKVDYY